MADVLHSGTSITGGHTNAVAAGAAGFMTGADKTKLNGISTGADVTSAALVAAGTTTTDVAAAALAKIGGYTQIAKASLTLGTGAVLSLTDASFTGKVAGGRGDLQGASGVLGVVAGSFASSAAETGTGANQAGLGSAAAAGQPYNVTDFPGQNQYAQCVLLTADRRPITLVQMVAGSITDATAEVYGYLAFRSDLGANLKWRLYFYYRRAADGFEVPFTPTVSLTNCWLEVPEIFLDSALAPGFGLSQTTAGPAVSPIPTLDKVPAPVASVSFASQEALLLAAPTAATSAARRSEVDGAAILVQAATTAALPAYTLLSGTVASGDALFEANVNGAFPTLDGWGVVTAAASGEPVSSRFLLVHGAATSDNNVCVLTVQGSGGTKFRFAQYSGTNTIAKINGSKLRILSGEQRGGAEYQDNTPTARTLGTSAIFWRRTDAKMGINEGLRFFDDCGSAVVTLNVSNGPGNLNNTFAGTSSAITQTNPTSGASGEYQWNMGTGVASTGTTYGPAPILTGANVDIDVTIRFQSAVLSTGAQEYALNVGVMKELALNQHTPTNGFCFVYDRVNKGTNLFALTISAGTSTATYTDTGVVYNAGQRYRGRIVRRAGDPNAYYYLDGVLVATHAANHPNAAGTLDIGVNGSRLAGTTTGIFAYSVDFFDVDVQVPTLRAA